MISALRESGSPPNAQLLYTANFAEGFAAEDRVVAGDLLITSLKLAM